MLHLTRQDTILSSSRAIPLLDVCPLGSVALPKESSTRRPPGTTLLTPPTVSASSSPSPGAPVRIPKHQQVLPPHLHTAEFYQRLWTEMLSFIFFYLQGTKVQYQAAKALKKKQSWQFHTRYVICFQRHKEPEATAVQLGQGT